MKKKIFALFLSVLLMAGLIPMNTFAATKRMSDGQIFDANFYATMYPDVAKQFGNDENELYEHYKYYGKSERRYPYATAACLLGQYDDVSSFIENDVQSTDVFWMGIDQWKYVIKAAVTGQVSNQKIADIYMNDPVKVRLLLGDIVNSMYSIKTDESKDAISAMSTAQNSTGFISAVMDGLATAKTSVSDDGKKYISNMALGIYESDPKQFANLTDGVQTITGVLQAAYSINDDLKKAMADYQDNIAFLDNLITTLPQNSTLRTAAEALKQQYCNQVLNSSIRIVSQVVSQANSNGFLDFANNIASKSEISDYNDIAGVLTSDDKGIAYTELFAKKIFDVIGGEGTGKGIAYGETLWKLAYTASGRENAVTSLEKIVTSSSILAESQEALREAESEFINDPTNNEKALKFSNLYELTRALLLEQYEDMLVYYENIDGTSNKVTEINEKISQIKVLELPIYILSIAPQKATNQSEKEKVSVINANTTENTISAAESVVEVSQYIGKTFGEIAPHFPAFIGPIYQDAFKDVQSFYEGTQTEITGNIEMRGNNNVMTCIELYNNNKNTTLYSCFGITPRMNYDEMTQTLENAGFTGNKIYADDNPALVVYENDKYDIFVYFGSDNGDDVTEDMLKNSTIACTYIEVTRNMN